MRRRADELAALFTLALTSSLAGCAGAETVDGTIPPVGSSATVEDPPLASATAVASTSGSAAPRPPPPPHDDSTPEGYASAFQSIGTYSTALSGLELLGFADVVDGKMTWEGKDCPPEWNTLVDGTFTRAAIVRKSRTLAVITEATFERWVGPVDAPEKAALRTQLEAGRTLATCERLRAEGFACAAGSAESAVAVREVEGGFEVATYDVRPVCGTGRWGMAVALGTSRVTRVGQVSEARNVLTQKTYAAAQETVECHYPIRGRAYEGFVDAAPEANEREYYARAAGHEVAAAVAFERLARELASHGAPDDLVADARRAAEDERRHAGLFFAALHDMGADGSGDMGADAPAAAVDAEPTFVERSLLALLLENAAEGCANETYAAVVATHQAVAAPSTRLRAVFSSIAPDEQRHAELAHRIHAWGLSRVDAADRARLIAAFAAETAQIAEIGGATQQALALGEPLPELARAAFRRVLTSLVAPSAARVA